MYQHSPRSEERPFDVILFEDIQGNWKKLGSGSFGNVYKGTYLGIDVAIKEVLPSTDYDVAKYFEREWRLMKECRHPNVVLYLGLSRAPEPDGRVFIISEFIENGNLRQYIHDKAKHFPWRMRISFATDIARALAYLHARKCIHRDIKGENLLVTANGRLKITDFGFARIAARSAEESKRLTFCGTDSYMSPEILLGDPFDLPTDIFSMGIILCEIAARRLADDYTFKRSAPTFAIDEEEVRRLAKLGDAPASFVELTLACLAETPSRRPTMRDILARLREIELEVLARPEEGEDVHVGSVKFATGNRRPAPAPRIPSFGMGVGKDIRSNGAPAADMEHSSDESSDEELINAMKQLDVNVGDSMSVEPLLSRRSAGSDYSTTVVRAHPHRQQATTTVVPPLSSLLTIRSPQPTDNATFDSFEPIADTQLPTADSNISLASFHTASSSLGSVYSVSSAGATMGGGGSTIRATPSALVHRFTLIKPGARRNSHGNDGRAGMGNGVGSGGVAGTSTEQTWSPFGFFFSAAAARCDLCTKRLGMKAVLECDDCGLRAHLKCGELAPMDCGLRPVRTRVSQAILPASPLSKGKSPTKRNTRSPRR